MTTYQKTIDALLAYELDAERPYYYSPGEDDIPERARRFVEIPPARDDMSGRNGCWLGIAGCKGNCGSYGCGG